MELRKRLGHLHPQTRSKIYWLYSKVVLPWVKLEMVSRNPLKSKSVWFYCPREWDYLDSCCTTWYSECVNSNLQWLAVFQLPVARMGEKGMVWRAQQICKGVALFLWKAGESFLLCTSQVSSTVGCCSTSDLESGGRTGTKPLCRCFAKPFWRAGWISELSTSWPKAGTGSRAVLWSSPSSGSPVQPRVWLQLGGDALPLLVFTPT